MGGYGSGLHGKQGRKPGGLNTPAAIERIRETMKAHHLRIAARPWRCQKCGEKVKRRSTLDRAGGQWVCPDCFLEPLPPLHIEDFVYRREQPDCCGELRFDAW